MDLVLATTNPGKVREIRTVLNGAPITLKTLTDFPAIPEPEETGETFAENALLKAQYYAAALGTPTVAEDSGLAIDALNGRPGVASARYPGATYPEKFAGLWRELAGHPRPWRARYVCSIAFVDLPGRNPARPTKSADPARPTFICEDTVEGEIATEARGQYGFGYDPIFYYPPYGATLGEVTDEKKLVVAHRGKAFRQFRQWLERNYDR